MPKIIEFVFKSDDRKKLIKINRITTLEYLKTSDDEKLMFTLDNGEYEAIFKSDLKEPEDLKEKYDYIKGLLEE